MCVCVCVCVYVLKRVGMDRKRRRKGIEIKIVTGRDRVKKGRKSKRKGDRERKRTREKKIGRKLQRDKTREIEVQKLTLILDFFQQSLNGRLSLFSRLLEAPCQVRRCQLQTNNSARQTSALVPYTLLCRIMSFCMKSK